MQSNYRVGEKFKVSKTQDWYVEVDFYYETETWSGCLPLLAEKNGIEIPEKELEKYIPSFYSQLDERNKKQTVQRLIDRWKKQKETETHKVFMALTKCEWICRTCITGKINDQPPARIRDIKKFGFTIATRSIRCKKCAKKTYHDILLPFDFNTGHKSHKRKSIPKTEQKNIRHVLKHRHAFWAKEERDLLIDHKFPSQRWLTEETDNVNLTNEQIKNKFQLLDNQTNMLKSRMCDSCVSTNERPSFLGIEWFYEGDKRYIPNPENPEESCVGCAWYDIDRWRYELLKFLGKK